MGTKYFNGEIELKGIGGMAKAKFAAAFPGVSGLRMDSFDMLVGYADGSRVPLPVERRVHYKSFPSKHECDARCMNASGRTMNCECSCGGKNHGRGSFNCVAA